MDTSVLRSNIATMRAAVRAGADAIRQMVGRPTDPDLAVYRRLKPEQFKQMIDEFGQPEVERYIRHMELRLTQQGGGGGKQTIVR